MKKILCIVLIALLTFSLCACETTDDPVKEETPDNTGDSNEGDEQNESKGTSYQSILDDYTDKIKDAIPTLIEEYNSEASQNQNGLTGLAEISNAKIAKLAEISNEGVNKMAEHYFSFGSGQYSEYEEWSAKLISVYTEEATKITDAYMNSAMQQ